MIARGKVLEGFLASPAVIPTISVPWNEKPADSKTLTVPTAPLTKAPGSSQYLTKHVSPSHCVTANEKPFLT